MSTSVQKKRKQDKLLELITAFAKEQECFGPMEKLSNNPLPQKASLTPDQLLHLQTLFGHTDEMPIALTLGADPNGVLKLAEAIGHQPTTDLLEQNGATLQRKRPKHSR